jgi:lipopolysaccharide/colanic/teichoic acid biosynthesis glycosyltransferase
MGDDSHTLSAQGTSVRPLTLYAVTKRMIDFTAALFGLLVLSPLIGAIAALVKLNSKGPVFYRGLRTGRHGVPFRIFKFRTMVANAEKIGGTSTAETDPRITKIGCWLRRHKLDELPQLINVLKGEMSLVGPRPEVDEYTRLYTPEEREILDAVPGITDLASVKFRHLNVILANSDDPDKYYADVVRPVKNKLRLEYVKKRSLWLDLKIICQTLRAIWAD